MVGQGVIGVNLNCPLQKFNGLLRVRLFFI